LVERADVREDGGVLAPQARIIRVFLDLLLEQGRKRGQQFRSGMRPPFKWRKRVGQNRSRPAGAAWAALLPEVEAEGSVVLADLQQNAVDALSQPHRHLGLI